jgi:hypothetical protein
MSYPIFNPDLLPLVTNVYVWIIVAVALLVSILAIEKLIKPPGANVHKRTAAKKVEH